MKQRKVFVCSECGVEYPKWSGQCFSCQSWNTLVEKEIATSEIKASKRLIRGSGKVVDLKSVQSSEKNRISTGLSELDNALSGGFLSDQVMLLTGEPGVGKSTILLQVAFTMATNKKRVLYVSGEESDQQVAERFRRLYPGKKLPDVPFLASPGLHLLLDKIKGLQPNYVILDSVQTIYSEELNNLPGSLSQIKACTSELVSAAKNLNFGLLIVGHINKEGTVAGPKALEHMVDTVVHVEGERDGEYRLVRVLKNRFGSTGEVGVLIMTETGLSDMDSSYNLFDSHEEGVGMARTLVVEGNRPIVIQVQALTNRSIFAYPKRIAEGISVSRLQLVCAILDRFTGVDLSDKDVYVRTSGGYKLSGASADLGIATAILSSVLGQEGPSGAVFVGELNLNGGVSLSRNISSKLGHLSKLGFSKLITSGKVESPKELKLEKLSSISGLPKKLKS